VDVGARLMDLTDQAVYQSNLFAPVSNPKASALTRVVDKRLQDQRLVSLRHAKDETTAWLLW